MKRVFLVGVCLWVSAYSWGQTVEYLVAPLWIQSTVPGAHGSLWTTEMIVFNSGDEDVIIGESPESCQLPEGCGEGPTVIRPGETRSIEPLFQDELVGRRLYIVSDGGIVEDLEFNLRIFDLSRQSETYGVELPVLALKDFREKVTLVKIPLGEQFRQAVRVYAWNLGVGDFVQLDLIDIETGAMIASDLLPVERTATTPGFVQVLDLLDRYPELLGYEAVRAVITPVQVTSEGTDPRLIWAFASVTHDQTQHVTTITPQP